MTAQIVSVVIFVLMFALIVTDKIERHIVTLVCGLATLILVFGVCMHSMTAVSETLNIGSIFTRDFWYVTGTATESSKGINWATIIFIAGMMVMVEGMARELQSSYITKYFLSLSYSCYYPQVWQCLSTALRLSCFWQQLP